MRKKDEQEEQQVCSQSSAPLLRLPLLPVIVQRRHTGRRPTTCLAESW